MSKIKVKEEELNQFARIIGKVEDQCGEAIRHLNVDLTSLLSNIPGVSTRRIQDIEARYNQVIHKYREKLDYAQQLLKKTEAGMKQDEKNLTMKAGELGLELLGYYDAQRAFGEYDPITGEKVSVGERLLAFGMLALTVYPPAKVVGVGGKVAIKGINAGTKFGFASFAKNLPIFNSIKNMLNTKKVLEVFKGIYKEVVKTPLAATKLWLERTVKQIGDFRLLGVGQQLVASLGAIPSKTVGEAFKETKDYFVKMASGEADNRSVWRETKGTGEVAGLKSRNLSSEQIELDWLADKYTAVEVKGTVKVGGKEVDVSRRVYQIEIDKNYVPNNPKALGKSNRGLMEKGKSPYFVNDGVESKVELHHLIQKEPGGMVEIAELTHDKYDSTLHGLVENGKSFRNNPELEKMYNNFRINYWKMRASE